MIISLVTPRSGDDDAVTLADDNQDGNISPADFSAWIINFNAGCP